MKLNGHKAVFLDRDGVLNEARVECGKPLPPERLEELRITHDASSALERLRNEGFHLICVTNQPDVARGRQRRELVEEINDVIKAMLSLDDIRTCFHDDSDRCTCRKPAPGLLLDAAEAYSLELQRCFLIGDRWSDIEAGRRAGCSTVLLGNGYGQMEGRARPNHRADSLTQAVDWILANELERGIGAD